MQKKQGPVFVTTAKYKISKIFYIDDISVHKVYVSEHPGNCCASTYIRSCGIGWWSRGYERNNNRSTSRNICCQIFLYNFRISFLSKRSLAFLPDGKSFSTDVKDGFISH